MLKDGLHYVTVDGERNYLSSTRDALPLRQVIQVLMKITKY